MRKSVILLYFLQLSLLSVAGHKYKNYLETSLYSVDEKIYPRFIIEGQENLLNSKSFGVWVQSEYSGMSYIPCSWKNKGYAISDEYNLDIRTGITYSYLSAKFIFGAGCSFKKDYLGPLFGVEFNQGKFDIQALGLYATNTPYKSKYSEEKECIPQIYIRGFDPNSWYRIEILYSISKEANIGLISERFYGTGITSQYSLCDFLKFKFMFGRELEFEKNVFCFGLIFKTQ